MEQNETDKQKSLVLHTILSDNDLYHIIELSEKIKSFFDNIDIFNEHRRMEILSLNFSKNNTKDLVDDDKSSFIEKNIVSIAPSPVIDQN